MTQFSKNAFKGGKKVKKQARRIEILIERHEITVTRIGNQEAAGSREAGREHDPVDTSNSTAKSRRLTRPAFFRLFGKKKTIG